MAIANTQTQPQTAKTMTTKTTSFLNMDGRHPIVPMSEQVQEIAQMDQFSELFSDMIITLRKDYFSTTKRMGSSVWNVSISGLNITYTHGSAYRALRKRFGTGYNMLGNIVHKRGLTVHEAEQINSAVPCMPNKVDVLYALYIDASSVMYETFNDWCESCELSNDSIKARDAYQQCQETLTMFRQHGINIETLDELFQDY